MKLDSIIRQISDICEEEFGQTTPVELTRPDERFGDLSTNVAMQLASKVGKDPREIAETIVAKLAEQNTDAEVAGPGFINLKLSDERLYEALSQRVAEQPRNGNLLLEYSCPNPFKELHVGHLYQTILGDALARVHEKLGTKVFRINFGGDVGLHVAKSIWGMIEELGGENSAKLEEIPEKNRSSWLAKVYVAGSKAYEDDPKAKNSIASLNKRIYEIHENNDKTSDLARLYWQTRSWSYDYFKSFYKDLRVVEFDEFFGESQTIEPGLKLVRDNTGKVFEPSDGAIIFSKERSKLHTRVFVTSDGLPTYEAKDLGVIKLETNKYGYDKRIIITGNDQKEYMKVVFAALKMIEPDLGKKQVSLTNGIVKFSDGQKMSSRLGNVTRAVDVLSAAKEAAKGDEDVALGAVKYSFLKSSIGGDISFDLSQSVSLEGNSGPYLQYALVRARSILSKSSAADLDSPASGLNKYERRLLSWLGRYQETLSMCAEDNSLHHLCTYLYELAQVFNQFYEKNRVIGDERSNLRLNLLKHYEKTLFDGLDCLGMPKPEKM